MILAHQNWYVLMIQRIWFALTIGMSLGLCITLSAQAAPLNANANALSSAAAPQTPALFDASHIVVRTAGRWSNYHADVYKWGSQNIRSAKELDRAMLNLASYNGANMAPGWIATAALIAVQVPEFVDGVHKWDAQYGHDLVLTRLHNNPMFASMFPGAKQAEQTVLRAAKSDAVRVKLVGSLFKEQAYSMQNQSWANRKNGGKAARLAAIKVAPHAPRAISQATLNALAAPGLAQSLAPSARAQTKSTFLSALKLGPSSAWASAPSNIGPTAARGREITMGHILGLAALLVLSEDPAHPNFRKWMNDRDLHECIDWSILQLNQCVAAGHFVFESSFCIAEHQLIDGGKCIESVIAGTPH